MEEIDYNEGENEQQNEIMFNNNDNQEIKNAQQSPEDLEKPKTMIQKIYKKIPTIFSWGFSFLVFVGTPTFLQLRNMGFYQWIAHNGGFKPESLAALGIRPY